ncbi:uncharacterized protein LOC143290256 [Babylonia areolata]|uniref:uncharacterized protein LOC143290256 n=1 Tax=Babylonia areolata TaxID=304850 RepID=UPI003FCFEA16
MFLSAPTMCFCGLWFAVVFLTEPWTVGGSKAGCPLTVQQSSHFAKVHNGNCYLFVDHERYWGDARDSCWELGGEMLSVENPDTMAFISSVLNSQELGWNKKGVWLGARYTKGRWRWTSGRQVRYANWAYNQPSKILGIFSVEDCALMRRRENWRWHDYICGRMNYHFNYICQFPAENVTTTTTTTTSTTTTTTTTSSVTATAAVFKPGHSSKKGHFIDGMDSKLNSRGFHQQEDKIGEEAGSLDSSQNGVPSHPYNAQGKVPGHPYDRHPAFNERGYNEVHSTTSQAHDNGNLTILTIILVSGGIVLMILLLIFLIVRKRYNYKKAMAHPTVHFENRNYNHAHGGSGHCSPQPPPPAPHSFHRATAPPIPPRPLDSRLPCPLPDSYAVPHRPSPFIPPRPASEMYLTPLQIGGSGLYEEINVPRNAAHMNHGLDAASLHGVGVLGASGGQYPLEPDDSATTPLISGQSEESLQSMSGSLTMKTSSIHNDYVDMNGAPVVPARMTRGPEAPPKTDEGKELDPEGKKSDPEGSIPNDSSSDMAAFQGEGKHAVLPHHYSNLMTTSQERCENLYAQLH